MMSSAEEPPLNELSASIPPVVEPVESSTGLSPRLAAALAYGGWWVSGLLFWWIERRDAFVRFHAAQSVVAFGLVALLIALFGGLGVLSLSVMPSAFGSLMWAAGATWIAGLLLWLAAIASAARGRLWRLPVAGRVAERLGRVSG
jgi:uncharacterized membrane protein